MNNFVKLGIEPECLAEGMDFVPCPGAIGEAILNGVAEEAWRSWNNRHLTNADVTPTPPPTHTPLPVGVVLFRLPREPATVSVPAPVITPELALKEEYVPPGYFNG